MKLSKIFFALTISIGLTSCNNTETKTSSIELDKKIYTQAINLGDFTTAAQAIHSILAKDSTQKSYLDTLVNVYYSAHMYMQTLKACEKWNSLYPATENILRIKGSSFEIIGAVDSAYEAYDKLYLMAPKTKHLFKVALYELLMGKEKGFEKLTKVREAKDLETDSVEIFWQEQNYMQFVKLNAALAWLDAAMLTKSGNIAGAKKGLETAVMLDPNFEMARYYVDNLNKQAQGQPRR